MKEEQIIETVRSLYRLLASFQNLTYREILVPGEEATYQQMRKDSYRALMTLQLELDRLNTKLSITISELQM